jgi:ADP-ribosylglycohydrolase
MKPKHSLNPTVLPGWSRRQFLAAGTAATLATLGSGSAAGLSAEPGLERRVEGLLLGTFFGDALGGPIEFQDPLKVHALSEPPKVWRDDEVLDGAARRAAAARVRLRGYRELRPVPEPFAHWTSDAEPGTITDDSRHKLVLLECLETARRKGAWPMGPREFARTFLDWPRDRTLLRRPGYAKLNDDWLHEWRLASRWVLGERDPARALPPERMWNGLPTCCGQMSLLPLAAIYPGQPEAAYRAAFALGWSDNGWGRDLNAALVAALAQALVVPVDDARPGAAWKTVLATLRGTDPFRYGAVPWCSRAVHRWLDLALGAAERAEGRPARLFATLEKEFAQTVKWEAQVPYVVTFACLRLAEYDPLAALQLSIEWGHDTDSYAQLTGAFIGALHGPGLFPASGRTAVTTRLRADYGVEFTALLKGLGELRQLARRRALFRDA